MISGRSGRIRTCDPCVPNAVLYRAEPHSDKNAAYSLGFRTPQEGELRTLTPLNVGLKTQILPAGEAAAAAAARALAGGGRGTRRRRVRCARGPAGSQSGVGFVDLPGWARSS